MARAEKIRGLKPRASLRENAVKVIEQRLEELLSWKPALSDEADVAGLHNMRIAAKRVRYGLETFEFCFTGAKPVAKELTRIQEELGDIHDLDVLGDLLRARLATVDAPLVGQAVAAARAAGTRAEHAAAVRKIVGEQSRDPVRVGLLSLIGSKAVERETHYRAFRERWGDGRLEEFADDVRSMLQTRPEPDGSHGG